MSTLSAGHYDARFTLEEPTFGAGATLVVGAVTGLALGYLFFTEPGRRFRQRVEPVLESWIGEINRLMATVERAREVWAERGPVARGTQEGPAHA